MLSNKKVFAIFTPILLLVGLFLGYRIIQYEPLYPKIEQNNQKDEELKIPILTNDPIIGKKNAGITIIAFEDFACDACKRQDVLMAQILEKHSDKVKIIWKGLPVTSIPYPSNMAHRYAFCASKENKFEEFKETAFTINTSLSEENLQIIAETIGMNTKALNECLDSSEPDQYISDTEIIAKSLNLQAVPAIFVNNKQITSPTSLFGWETALGLSDN